MNLSKRLILALLIAFSGTISAQSPITIGHTHSIQSEILDQQRILYVNLPDTYDESDQAYPVLFILDGQWHFTNGVAIQQSLRVPDYLPEMIVIGIENANPLRRTLFWDEKEKFLSFLGDEVIPFIEENFRASDDRILFGWESAAHFTSFALFHQSQLFTSGIVSNGGSVSVEMINAFKEFDHPVQKHLFIANSFKDIYTVRYANRLSQQLNNHSPIDLRWKYAQFDEEVHESLAYLALYHGLTDYYYDFPSLVFGSIAEFHEKGGHTYLDTYFKQRGKRYGFPTEVDNSTKNSLIWLAWKRNDFESFTQFMTKFQEVLTTQRYASAYWQNRFGQFYLKHGDLDNAILYFNAGINQYPNPEYLAQMYAGLGEAYYQKGDKKKAVEMAELALSKVNDNHELAEYEHLLEKVKR